MKNKKMNENELMERLPPELAGGVDGADYNTPRATQRELVALGHGLKANAPDDLNEIEASALNGVVKGVQYVALAMANNERLVPATKARELRMSVVKEVSSIKGVLTMIAKSEATDVSSTAKQVLEDLYRGDLDRAPHLGPRGLWQTVQSLEDRLSSEPEQRKRLEEVVPKSMVARLVQANAALGDALGVTQRHGKVLPLDTAATKAFLRRRLTRYIAALVASADPDVPATSRRTALALQPVLALRDEVTRRHSRRPDEPEAEEALDDEDDDEPSDVTPAPTPEADDDDDDVPVAPTPPTP